MKFSSLALAAAAFVPLVCQSVSAAPAAEKGVEKRFETGYADIVGSVAELANAITEGKAADDELRARFAQNMIDGMRQTWGDEHNYVICHTDHEYQWNGAEGADWGHAHYELDIQIGGTVGYEVYGSNVGGYFKRKGDGGYLNWEWYGFTSSVEEDGSRINFIDH